MPSKEVPTSGQSPAWGRSVIGNAPAADPRPRDGGGPRAPASSRLGFSSYSPLRRAITMAVLTLPSAASITARAASTIQSGGLHHDALAPVESLALGAQIDHQIAVNLSQADHRARGQRIEHQLGSGARLHSGGASDDLGPTSTVMNTSQTRGHLRGRVRAGDRTVRAPRAWARIRPALT